MTSMITKTNCSVLEPTAGSGRFVRKLKELDYQVSAVEVDDTVVPNDIKSFYEIADFFAWEGGKFPVIIGNPPYVNGRLIDWSNLGWGGALPKTANLYLHVIEKCVKNHLTDQGEIIFIVPSSLLSGTSLGSELRSWMVENGSFTHFIKPDVKWEKASVETCIFRWVKGAKQGLVETSNGKMNLHFSNGMIKIINFNPVGTLGSFFQIGVGAAPSAKFAADESYGSPFISNGVLKYYDVSNFRSWPRSRLTAEAHKILVLPGPTRKKEPFYTTNRWDAKQASRHTDHFLIPKTYISDKSLEDVAKKLNEYMSINDEMLMLRHDGRWSAGVKDLINMPLSKDLHDFLISVK
jgi:hypothetical protein